MQMFDFQLTFCSFFFCMLKNKHILVYFVLLNMQQHASRDIHPWCHHRERVLSFRTRVEGNAWKMVRSVLANYHQGCQIFAPFNGVQCTAIALITLLIFMNCFNSPQLVFMSDFPSIQLDQMLHDDSRLYASISQELQSLQ